jgi:enhancer of yellow 2 transcription factor
VLGLCLGCRCWWGKRFVGYTYVLCFCGFQFVQSGERDRLKALLRDRLLECGWKDDIKQAARGRLLVSGVANLCRGACTRERTLATPFGSTRLAEFTKSKGRENVTAEDIVRAIRPIGRQRVPDNIKAELLARIRTFILS